MKLPSVCQVFKEDVLISEVTKYHEVGETTSVRVRCPKCLNLYSVKIDFIDQGDGTMVWYTTSKVHC